MSFILDALKKSESERLQKGTPGIANIAESGRQHTSRKWVWLVLALLTINLVAVTGLIYIARPEPSAISLQPASEQPQADEAAAVATVDIAEEAAETKQEPSPAVRAEPEVKVAEPVADRVVPAASTTETLPTGAVYSGLDSFNELRARGRLSLPDLHLDIHVYGGQAADRFVFVNMSKYTEGATLSEGPAVREITPDGVVLDYQGTTFLLPRE